METIYQLDYSAHLNLYTSPEVKLMETMEELEQP